jgi:hypothetical protein
MTPVDIFCVKVVATDVNNGVCMLENKMASALL